MLIASGSSSGRRLKGKLEVSAATTANEHEAAVRSWSDDIFYPQVIEPAHHSENNPAFILFDDPKSCHSSMGEAFAHLPVHIIF